MTETMTATTFSDMFKNSFLRMFPETVDPWKLVTVLAVSLLLGLGIFAVYRRCFMGVVYDHSFNISLVVMTILTAVIIVTISSNIMLSLGMVGALSIVRYRTAVKSPLDLMFMFWSITTGIASGAGYYYIAAVSFLFTALVFWILKGMKHRDETYMLVIHCQSGTEAEEAARRSLASCRSRVRSKVLRGGQTELTMEVVMKHDNINLVDTIARIPGVEDVTLVQYRGIYED